MTMHAVGTVSVVIVSFRDEPLLAACLGGLARCRAASDGRLIREVLVVDNGGALPPYFAMLTDVRVLSLASAIPYAAALNRGVAACAPESPFIWILDSDQIPAPGVVEELWRQLLQNPELAAVGPRQVSPRGNALAAYGYFPRAITQAWELVPSRVRTQVDRRLRRGDLLPVDYLPMGGMLIRRLAVPQGTALLNEGWSWGNHDLDLCYRWYQAGWQVGVTEAVALVHDINSPMKPEIGDRFVIGQVSLIRWAGAKLTGRQSVSFRVLFATRLLVQAITLGLVGRRSESASRLHALREAWPWLITRGKIR